MKTTKKGFSLVELVVTLVLIAELGCIAIGGYNNISKSAQAVAQNQDQQTVQQIIESFHTSSGDMSYLSPELMVAPYNAVYPTGSDVSMFYFSPTTYEIHFSPVAKQPSWYGLV
jgi:prepilin-type N-terminal cleavage/methylation domain-containing protein